MSRVRDKEKRKNLSPRRESILAVCRRRVTTNSVNMTYARHDSPSSSRWLERPTGVWKVMGAIPMGDSDFFFVPRSRHVDYSIFSYFFSELKIYHLSLFIKKRSFLSRLDK